MATIKDLGAGEDDKGTQSAFLFDPKGNQAQAKRVSRLARQARRGMTLEQREAAAEAARLAAENGEPIAPVTIAAESSVPRSTDRDDALMPSIEKRAQEAVAERDAATPRSVPRSSRANNRNVLPSQPALDDGKPKSVFPPGHPAYSGPPVEVAQSLPQETQTVEPVVKQLPYDPPAKPAEPESTQRVVMVDGVRVEVDDDYEDPDAEFENELAEDEVDDGDDDEAEDEVEEWRDDVAAEALIAAVHEDDPEPEIEESVRDRTDRIIRDEWAKPMYADHGFYDRIKSIAKINSLDDRYVYAVVRELIGRPDRSAIEEALRVAQNTPWAPSWPVIDHGDTEQTTVHMMGDRIRVRHPLTGEIVELAITAISWDDTEGLDVRWQHIDNEENN